MPTGWRIVKAQYAALAFDGEGAKIYGGRWNSQGIKMVYTAQSASLAVFEILVHLNDSNFLADYRMYAIHFNDSQVMIIDVAQLPENWQAYPPPPELQHTGDLWTAGKKSVVLQVPSVIVSAEHNFLINPEHPDYRSLKIDELQSFYIDSRLMK